MELGSDFWFRDTLLVKKPDGKIAGSVSAHFANDQIEFAGYGVEVRRGDRLLFKRHSDGKWKEYYVRRIRRITRHSGFNGRAWPCFVAEYHRVDRLDLDPEGEGKRRQNAPAGTQEWGRPRASRGDVRSVFQRVGCAIVAWFVWVWHGPHGSPRVVR